MYQIETNAKGRKLLKEKMPTLGLRVIERAVDYIKAVSLLRQERIEFKGVEVK